MAVRQVKGRASWGKTYRGFSQALSEAGKVFTEQGIRIFTKACENWLADQNGQWPRGEGGGAYRSGYRGGNYYYPWYTGTLHDSMATVISDRNRVVGIRYMQDISRSHAWKNQEYKGEVVNGREWAEEVARRSQYVFLPGIQMRLVVGVPYAEKVNESPLHRGFIKEFERDFGSTMTSIAESRIKNIAFKAK